MRLGRATSAALGVLTLGWFTDAPAVAQDQPRTFRSTVTVVRLDVSVVDRSRRPIRGLERRDFTVLVDGVPQELVDVAEVDYLIDRTTPSLPALPPGFVSNQGTSTRRAFVIILDDALTAGEPFMLEYSRKAAHAFVDGLRADDVAAVVFTWNGKHNQDFTADRQRVHDAIDRFQPGPDDFEWAPLEVLPSRDRLRVPSMLALARTVRDVARALNEAPHLRGAIVLISPGMVGVPEVTMSREDPLGLRTMEEGEVVYGTELASTAGEAAYARVPIYAVSNRGLVAPGPGPNPWRMVTEARRANDFLATVANASGGFAVVNANDPRPGIQRVLRENSHGYVVGYEANYPVEDGKYRRLQIRVNRRGAIVEPSGRFIRTPTPAPAGSALSPRSAIAGILPMQDVPLAARVTVENSTGEPRRAAVTVDLQIGPVAGATGDAHVECVAFDAGRLKEVGSASAQAALTAGGTAQVRVSLAVTPGRRNLRCGVHLPGSGKLGSLYLPLDIPDPYL